MEKDQQVSKQHQEVMNYLRHRVMPILEPLQFDILTQRPADIYQFSYFWLQNFKQQQNQLASVSSDDEQPDQTILSKLKNKKSRRQKGRQGISGQIYSTIKTQQLTKSYWNKNEQDKIKILVKLRNHIFFKNLSETNIEEIIKCMKSITYKQNDVVIKEGDIGNQLFLVDSGIFKCVFEAKKEDPKFYMSGEAFGELALLYNTKRACTITAASQGRLFSLDRSSFNSILRDEVFKKTKICQETLSKNIIFSTLTPYEKCKLIENIKEMSMPSGKYVIKEGQIGDSFYIVSSGKLVAEKTQQNGEIKSVYYFKQGDYFGQIALIRNVLRQASVKTLTSSKLFYIQRSTFKRLLGPLQNLLRRNEQRYKSIKQSVKKTII